MSYLTYLQVYVGAWCSTLLFFLNDIITYKQFVTIVAVLSALAIIVSVVERNGKISKKVLLVSLVWGTIALLYYCEPVFYNTYNDNHTSYLLVLIAQILPSVICAAIISDKLEDLFRIEKLTPIVSLIFSFIVYQGIIHPTGFGSGGSIRNENGISYNSGAYLVSYAVGLAEYYLLVQDRIEWKSIFKRKSMAVLLWITIFVNMYLVLIAGGRGGLVVFICETVLFLYLWIKKRKYGVYHFLVSVISFAIGIGISYYIVSLAANSTISYSGYNRILKAINEGDMSGRGELYKTAIEVFKENPIIGHGFGSVFRKVGFFSHNIFLDIGVETGVIGILVFFVFIVLFLFKIKRLINMDIRNSLWLIMFIQSFVQLLFSGYYLASPEFWWVLTMVICVGANVEKGMLYGEENRIYN